MVYDMTVGFVGLGVMGRPMAANLLAASGGLIVHHRSADRVADLTASGAVFAATPRELGAAARVVVLMLPDLPQVDEILVGTDGLVAGVVEADLSTVLVIGSTSSAAGVRELATRLDRESDGLIRVVDAPVSGGEDGAIAGTLAIMVGGADDDVATAIPVLATMGTPVHLGPLGSGQIAKYCNQLIVASTIMALGESAVLAERSGLDLQAMFTLLQGGYAGSRVLDTRKQRVVEEDYSPSGVAKYMVKDLTFAVDEARANGTDAALTRALLASFTDLVDRGFGDHDIAVTRAYVESRSGE